MKLTLKFLLVIVFTTCIWSCSKNEKVRDGFFRGMYEGGNKVQEMKHSDEPPQLDKEPPSYDQYKRERQKILTDHESNQSQQQ